MYAAQFQNAGVLAVRRVGRSADETCHCGCKTITEQGSVQARIRKEVLSYGCRDRRHIADMLHHGRDRDRCHDHNAGQIEFAELQRRKSDDACLCNRRKVDDHGSVRIFDAECIQDNCHSVGNHNAHQNRNDFEHSFSPDVENDDDCQRNQCQEPVRRSIINGGTSKAEANADDNRTCDNRRQVAHHAFDADHADDQGKNQVQKTCYHNTSAGIGCLVVDTHAGIFSGIQVCNSGETA